MNEQYTIGELAKEADVPVSTVRYYERVKLLKPLGRTAGNYRVYDSESLDRLSFIRAAQVGGFTLENVRALLELRECLDPCDEVRDLIEIRLNEVSVRIDDLCQVQRILNKSLAACQARALPGRCQVLENIKVKNGSIHSKSRRRRKK